MGNCQARAEKGELNFCDCIDEHAKCGTDTHEIDINITGLLKDFDEGLDCDINGRHKWIHKTLNCPTTHEKKKGTLGLCQYGKTNRDKYYSVFNKYCKSPNIEGFKEGNTPPPYIKHTENALTKQIDSIQDKLDNNVEKCIHQTIPLIDKYNNQLLQTRSQYRQSENCNDYKIDNNNCSGLDSEKCALKKENIVRQCNEKVQCIQRQLNPIVNGYQNINNNINHNIDNNNLNNIMYLLLIIFLIYIFKKNIKKKLIKNVILLIIILLIFIFSYININYV